MEVSWYIVVCFSTIRTTMNNARKQSFFSNLWERKVPQFVATYFGVCFTIIQFLNFVTERYSIDSSLIDKFITFCTVALPSLVLFTYNHGRPGHDPWTKLEKVFIPVNLLIAGILAFFVSGVTSKNEAPTEVTITNEEGIEESRMVPADNQVKKLAFFPFGVEQEDDSDWIRFGLPHLLNQDLEQDMRIYGRDADTYAMELESHDYKIRDKIPFKIKLDIARNTLANYLVLGEVKSSGDNWEVQIKVHDTDTGEIFLEDVFQGQSIYEVTDNISKQLHDQFFLKDSESGFSNFVDLPSEEIITADIEAFKSYIRAREFLNENDHQSALVEAQKGLELDSKSPLIMLLYSQAIRTAGDLQSSKQVISEALKLSDRLTERNEFFVKQLYYLYNDQTNKFLSLVENWIKLYPKDFGPYDGLLGFYTMTNQIDKAKEVGEKAIANGHRRRILTEMFDMSIRAEEYDEAEKYLDEYKKEFPTLYKNDTRRGELFEKRGLFDKSIAFYDQLLLNDPQNGRYMSKLAAQYIHKGDLDNYRANMNNALENADRGVDSVRILTEKMQTISMLGWKQEYIECAKMKMNVERGYNPELVVMSSSLLDLTYGAVTGADDFYTDYYDQLTQKNPQVAPIVDCASGFLINMVQRNLEAFKQYYQGQCKAIVTQGSPDVAYMADGYLASMEKDYDKAITLIETYIHESGSGSAQFGSSISEQYRLKGDTDTAIKICQDYLKTYPYSTNFLHELCQAQLAAKDMDGAKETYKKLSVMWADADPDFVSYDSFKKLGQQLSI